MAALPDEALGAIEAGVRAFCAREVDARANEDAGRLSPELLRAAAAAGLFASSIPEEHGGLGLGLAGVTRVVAAIAEHDRSLATCVGLHCGLGTRGLVTLAADPLRAAWLPRLASGECIASFAATEPSAGSDLASVRTTVRRDGDSLVVDGEKAFVTNGGIAGVYTVLAHGPDGGHSLVLVPRDAAGVEPGREERKLGLRASSTVSVRFDHVRIPASHFVGTPGRGLEDAQAVLAWGRTLMSAGCVGTARTALALSAMHATGRRQFGRNLVAFEAVRAHLAGMAATVRAIEHAVERVGRDDDEGRPISATSAALKVLASEGAFDVCDRAVQLHGALGYLEDAGVARLLRDCRVTRIFEGANDVLLAHLGTSLLARAPGADALLAVSDHHAVEARRLRIVQLLGATRDRLGVAAIRRQLLLVRLARAVVAYFAAQCLATVARRDIIDRHALRQALVRVDAELDATASAEIDADTDQAVVDALLEAHDTGDSAAPTRSREGARA